ncbi:MAG: hypothetical protein GX825_02350 [Syntrophomonadaceae bacterium]|nr:hypothetical protein [Syntrophomonadaceae bacterium]
MFKDVRTYIRENPGATIIETAEATEVPEETILRFLRDGRIISQGLKNSFALHCNRCGDVINSGTYCQTCRDDLNREIRQVSRPVASQEPISQSGDRMRILDSRKKNGR